MPVLRPHKLVCSSTQTYCDLLKYFKWIWLCKQEKVNKFECLLLSLCLTYLGPSNPTCNVCSWWSDWPISYPRSASPWAVCCVSASLAQQLCIRLSQYRHPLLLPHSETSFICQNVQQRVVSYENEWILMCVPKLCGKSEFLFEIMRDISKSFPKSYFDFSHAFCGTQRN